MQDNSIKVRLLPVEFYSASTAAAMRKFQEAFYLRTGCRPEKYRWSSSKKLAGEAQTSGYSYLCEVGGRRFLVDADGLQCVKYGPTFHDTFDEMWTNWTVGNASTALLVLFGVLNPNTQNSGVQDVVKSLSSYIRDVTDCELIPVETEKELGARWSKSDVYFENPITGWHTGDPGRYELMVGDLAEFRTQNQAQNLQSILEAGDYDTLCELFGEGPADSFDDFKEAVSAIKSYAVPNDDFDATEEDIQKSQRFDVAMGTNHADIMRARQDLPEEYPVIAAIYDNLKCNFYYGSALR